MALYESKYGVITQTDESTYLIGNYQIVAVADMWELSPVEMPTSTTWLTSPIMFTSLDDAFRVGIVFSKEDSLALGIRDMLYASIHRDKPHIVRIPNIGEQP